MIQAIANEPRRVRLRGTSIGLASLCISIELATAPALAADEAKPVEAKPIEAKPIEAKPIEAKSATAVADTTVPLPDAAESDQSPPDEMLAVPGSPRPYGMGLSAESPAVPATIGGRAPSFGAPGPKASAWSFRLGGRIAGFESFGLGQKPTPAPAGYTGTAIHGPAYTMGRGAIWAGAGLTLNMTYGNPVITANVNYWVSLNGIEHRGFYSPQAGPASGQAYLALTPPKLGDLQLVSKVGVFTEMYGGVGQWGWGIFGPLLAVRGFGESTVGEVAFKTDYRLWFAQGFQGVPRIEENASRGDYTGWEEPAKSSIVIHEHVGISYRNNHGLRLHHARIWGIDERRTLDENQIPSRLRDGHVDVYLFDVRTRQDPYGHIALAGALYDMKNAQAINDGLWWGIDWTQGASQQLDKFLGNRGSGTGRYGVLSAQWDFSLGRMLWHPRGFDGRHPDIRGGIAGMVHKTFKTDDQLFQNASGFAVGAELEYVLFKCLGVFLKSYGEKRDSRIWQRNEQQTFIQSRLGKFEVYSVMPGIIFRSDWAATDSIQLAYQRRWYGRDTDLNSAYPLDRDIFTIGATAQF